MSFKHKLYCNTLGCKMAFAVKGIKRMLRKQFEDEGVELTLEQYFVLNIIDNEEGLILQDIAEIVDRDKSAVLRHINGLEKHRFVVRTPDPEDKRRKLLIVTKPGINALEHARRLDHQLNDELISCLNDEKRVEMESILSSIYEKLLTV